MTLPDTKTGLVLASAAPGIRVEGVLREGEPEPVDPLPRCAVAVDTSKAIMIINRLLDRPETSTMAASIRKPKDFQAKRSITETFADNLKWYAFSRSASMKFAERD
jgi:hypothetical protein